MLSGFSTDNSNSVIKNEDELIHIFEHLIKNGLTPFEAYFFIENKYGEDEISKFLDNESLNTIK